MQLREMMIQLLTMILTTVAVVLVVVVVVRGLSVLAPLQEEAIEASMLPRLRLTRSDWGWALAYWE
jgi:hypothetical protein